MGLDIGTTGCKVAVFREDGALLGEAAHREYPLRNPRPGFYELEPEVVWEALSDAMRQVNAEVRADPVTALAVSAQGEAVVPVAADGRVLANSPVTSDNRARAECDWLAGRIGGDALYRITGRRAHPCYSIYKILWWREHQPQMYKQAWKFLCYGDFVIRKLGLEPAIDDSMAALTMAFDVRERVWSSAILDAVGLDAARLARVRPIHTVVGCIPDAAAGPLGFKRGVRVAIGGHDQVCGALGTGTLSPGQAVYAVGTSECILSVVRQPFDSLREGGFPYSSHVVPDRYVTMIGSQTGARLLHWYRDVLSGDEVRRARETQRDVYDTILSQVADRPSRLMILPHFAGSGMGINDPASKGAILGLTFDTRREDIVKAILEGVTYEMALNVAHLREAGVKIAQLRAIGGGARSAKWLQMKADILSVPITTLRGGEAAALGAALVAGWATGVYGCAEEAVERTVEVERTFEPDATRAAFYRERLAVYEKMYPAIRPLSDAM